MSVVNESQIPLGGRTKSFVHEWKRLTKDNFIINCIRGCRINFIEPPSQVSIPHQIHFNNTELAALDAIIRECVADKIIEPCEFEEGDYLNTVFLVHKRESTPENPSFRLILNMKSLNKKYVRFTHHKMHSLQTCIDLMEEQCFMASIDLRQAFHTIPMHPDYTKYLKFMIKDRVYKYLVMPMGFRDAPRLFCKILKPVLAHLRSKGHLSSIYIDDFFLMGKTADECKTNVHNTLELLLSLGFDISDKSCLIPTQQLPHLGFLINSATMTVSLTELKIKQIAQLITYKINKPFITVKELSSVIGTLVATFPGVEYGQLHYRHLECLKIASLRESKNYKRKVHFTAACKDELRWWLTEGLFSHKVISHGNPAFVVQTDASGRGWGALLLKHNSNTKGQWSSEEQTLHINVLELKAAILGTKALCCNLKNCHLQIQLDNSTAVTYINNMGGTHSRVCDALARELISWGKERNIWISATHIAGVSNKAADDLSRKFNDDIEWMLEKNLFIEICTKFGCPEVDLFASRINYQLPKYFSFYPDSEAMGIDAFRHEWKMFPYLFPPFNLIPRCLRKLREDSTEKAIMIVPLWKVAPWWPKLQKMLLKPPHLLKASPSIVRLPNNKSKRHPLFPKTRLIAVLLSGNVSLT